MNSEVETDLRQALQVLRRGGIILYPTDTVWGLGCDATNPEAVARIYALKKRAESKSMLTLMSDIGQVECYIDEPEEIGLQLLEISDKPMTVIFDGARSLAPGLVADDGSVGVRISRELYSSELTRRLGRPLVSTSANVSGHPTPAFFHEIEPEIIDGADYVARYRRDDTEPHTPSSVIKVGRGGTVKILRP